MMPLPSEIERRRELSGRVSYALTSRKQWASSLINLQDKCCIYITGSLARSELDENSDLDLFVVDNINPDDKKSALTYVEQSQVVSALDEIRRDYFADRKFSRGGLFLMPIPFSAMAAEIGDPQDDSKNLFTARMLLLINSFPLVNIEGYERLRSQIIDLYWSGMDSSGVTYSIPSDQGHKPIMFINDLRRWWLTVALNFERNNSHQTIQQKLRERSQGGIQSASDNPVIERRIADLKLRYARMLGVYSVLIGILAHAQNDGVLRTDFERIIAASPVDRLLQVAEKIPDSASQISSILASYSNHLAFLAGKKEEVASRAADDSQYKPLKEAAYEFHSQVFELMESLGAGSILYRYMVI